MSSLIITLICVWPHYSSLHILWRSAGLCCCCCKWCDVAVDLQTDKTQSSDTWWARCGAWECCLWPGGTHSGGIDVYNVSVFWNLDALKFESICLKITSQLSVWGLWHSSSFLYFWLVSVSNPVWPPGQCQRSGQCWRLMRVTTCGHAPVWGPGSFPRCRAQCHSGWSVSASPGATIMSRDMCHYLMMSWSEHLQWQQWMCHCHHLLLLDEWPHNKCFLPGDSFVRLLQCIRWPSLSFKLSKFLSQSCFASPQSSLQQRFSPSETIQL